MSKVVVLDCEDYRLERITDKINAGMEKLGGWEAFIKPGMNVLLKINLIGPKTAESAAVTHCDFVRAIIRILRERGCQAWIGDSAGGAIAGIAPTERGMQVSGMKKVADEESAVIKNFEREGVAEIKTPSGIKESIFLAQPVLEADFVINLPKLKTHSAAIYTGAVKNAFGLIPGLRKAEYHRIAPDPLDFGRVLVDIHRSARFGLHIMDGIIAMQGEGPTAGKPYLAQKILISTDPLALDVVGSAMLGIDVEDLPILKAFRQSGMGEGDQKQIEVVGDYTAPPLLENFMKPKRYKSEKKSNDKALSAVIGFFKSRPKVDLKLCKQCNTCVESCPVEAIDRSTKMIDYEKCIECLCCHELCMYKAVRIINDKKLASVVKRLSVSRYR